MIKGKKPSTVNEYIAAQPPELQSDLQELRAIIKKAAPTAEEKISYSMPAYKYNGMLVFFAAFKNHYGMYAPKATLVPFSAKLEKYGYEPNTATIRFPFNSKFPVKLITDIVKYGMKLNTERMQAKALIKTKKVAKKK